MYRRTFVKAASGAIASVGLSGVSSACEDNEAYHEGDPVIAELEMQEQISDGERGAMFITGEVIRVPAEFVQMEVTLHFRDEEGERIFSVQEATEEDVTYSWEFRQSWFGDAQRVEQVDRVTASVNIVQEEDQ